MGSHKFATTTRLRVGICGAGIGGLVLAVALSKYPDIEVTVYEAASKLAEVGAGVGIFPRPWEIIRKLDLEEELLRVTEIKRQEGPVRTFVYRKSDGPEGVEFYTLVTQGTLMMFHRADFQQVLLGRLDSSCKTHCGKRLRTYTQRPSEPIKLLFEDGSTATCDVLIGADGVKSAVRKTFMTEKAHLAQSEGRRAEAADCLASIEPAWSGTNSYRTLISADLLRSRYPNHRVFTQPMQYLGKNAHIIAYPISRGKLINFVAFISRHDKENSKFSGPWVTPTEREEMASTFKRWEPEVQALIDCVNQPLRWAIHTVRPLSTFVHGRVAVIGDAAHSMVPTQGSGAGQAIEDAFILATVLGNPRTDGSSASIQRALKVFDIVRRPRALEVQERSRLNGRYFSLNYNDVDFSSLQGEELRAELVELMETVKQNWAWTWTTSPRDSYEEATQLMES
ncbi:FAD/NAD(P)-binding domain-containing protein [Macrolepiota fuliginosa MF-IS2]|uniref:FAD/NAD(P)-binding domain-containing protein n=1 Tax=Macrolepiota fuliginosa MF-IS2 TaxID=1400762 RepID=A0A9P6C777_9AGAR|nr:FAD/NAD(P)-binding domain-containing protein [Macrolepiota fuliginosa MF-IS2]